MSSYEVISPNVCNETLLGVSWLTGHVVGGPGLNGLINERTLCELESGG